VALVCGELIVVDCDSPTALLEVLENCGHTPMQVATPTQGHFHAYYRARTNVQYGNAVNIRGEAKTIRALGAYAVAPWSVGYRFTGELVPLKELPVIKVGHLRERKRYISAPKIERYRPASAVGDTIHNIRAYIRRIPSDQGNNGSRGLMRVCYLLTDRFCFADALDELRDWNREIPRPPWEDDELQRALTNSFRRRMKEISG
jgi:hypothetical protein